MADNSWNMIVEPEKPIPVSELEVVVHEGLSPNFPISRSYERNMINAYWDDFVKGMAREYEADIIDALNNKDTKRFNTIMRQVAGISSMYRLNKASLNGKRLDLEMSITDFRDYAGTNQRSFMDPGFREMLMNNGLKDKGDPDYYFANPMATCANIVTSDSFIVIGTRSNKVAMHPGIPHLIAGHVKVNGKNKPDFTVKDVNIMDNMKKELYEEIGLNDEDLVSRDFLAIIQHNGSRHHEALYNVSLKINAEELYERWRTKSQDKFEHRNITMYKKDELPAFLERWKGELVPSGEATLKLFLKHYR